MYNHIDRYTVRTVVNDLIDRLIDECVSKKEIAEMLDLTDGEKEYMDINWLYENN